MQGKAMGQHYQWLEANLVFHVAHQLTLQGVPALTVHDEFIVREQDAELADLSLDTAPSAPTQPLQSPTQAVPLTDDLLQQQLLATPPTQGDMDLDTTMRSDAPLPQGTPRPSRRRSGST